MIVALTLHACLSAALSDPGTAAPAPSAVAVRGAIQRGVAFLLSDQNRDGSWGGPRDATYTGLAENPETHFAFTVGTTGLCCMALLAQKSDATTQAALDRAVGYLATSDALRRPSDWDLDHVWGHLYGLQAIARVLADARYASSPKRDRLKAAAQSHLDKLLATQSPIGGWGYLAFPDSAFRPAWATSFTTAATILALLDAQEAGFRVPEPALSRALRAVERCRVPNGAFTYSIEAVPSPGSLEGIDQVKGSLGRIQVCNLALRRAGKAVSDDDLARGLDLFFDNQRFLDIGRKRPIPHEAYYLVAGYFYYFGQYYAAEVLSCLPSEKRRARADRFLAHLIGTQETDGSMWDYVMHHYCKAYGTAYGVLALGLALDARS